MKCLMCKKDKHLHCRGMCPSCYTKWKRAGKPELDFDFRTPVERFKIDCDNGAVELLLEKKVPHSEIARKYNIAEATARKHMELHGIIVIKQKANEKSVSDDNFYSPEQMIALAMPWVKNETPRYYIPR